MELDKIYEPRSVEDRWYKFWLENNLFSPIPEAEKKPFSIVIPPPNVTGILHMGHALNNTLQDITIRFRGMQGHCALWVPGTDHGGIATQNVVEKLLKSEGKTREDIGRDKFLKKMWQWRDESGDKILQQLKRLGCSLDWSKTRFTMDDVYSKTVIHAFVTLYNRGLIYRGHRLVNWCTRCQTALSDIEVEHEQEIGKLWHIKYQIAGEKEEFIVVATTRPETMTGDTAVAVNPEDKRYHKLIGKKILLPLSKREIPIVADEAVDPAFGTGAVKVTPAHDPVDFDIASRHDLPQIVVIDTQGKMTDQAGDYKGLDRFAARKAILGDLAEEGLLLETTRHPHSIGHCYRCETVIEPLLSEQWFLKVGQMSQRAMKAAEDGSIKFYPESWKKPYMLWLEHLKDWCISRQIWWGHRIPVYYCVSKKGKQDKQDTKKSKKSTAAEPCPPIVAENPPEKCPHCGGTKIEQDPDVLDTWFSSALWPFGVFGWPKTDENGGDLKYFYPTSVLVTGHEILYLWVARMAQMGLEFMDDIPFREVFIHGIVRDKHGKKMSKSLGNVIDPIEIMDKYGTDALRFALAHAAAPGRDMQISDDSFIGARNFVNKIWNASRFVLMNIENVLWEPGFMAVWPLELADYWILSEYRILVQDVTKALSTYNIDMAARLIYEFFRSKYCDWYIEIAKLRLNGQSDEEKKSALSILLEVLGGTLRLLHPIMPFVTEEIWQKVIVFKELPGQKKPASIMKYSWPESDIEKVNEDAVNKMRFIMDIVTAIRTIRSEMNVPPAKNVRIFANVPAGAQRETIEKQAHYLKILGKLDSVEVGENFPRPAQSATAVISSVEIFIPLAGIIDMEKEKQRLAKELKNAQDELERCTKNMSNQDFLKRAPQSEVEKAQRRLSDAKLKIEKTKDNLKSLD